MKFRNPRFEPWRSSFVAPYFAKRPIPFIALQHKMSQPFGLGAFIEISGRFWILVGIEICSGNAADLRFIARARLGEGAGFCLEIWVGVLPPKWANRPLQ
jgi:hypothetical protein